MSSRCLGKCTSFPQDKVEETECYSNSTENQKLSVNTRGISIVRKKQQSDGER